MNVNQLAQKTLEWGALVAVGFYLGTVHVSKLAYSGRVLKDGVLKQPDWVQQVGGYDLPLIAIVVVATALWIGLDYYENVLIES